MGKIKKIKQERKRAEVEEQLKKMKRNRLIVRSIVILSFLFALSGGGFYGYKYLIAKYPNLAIKWNKSEVKKEETVTERKTYTKVPEMQIDVNKRYTAIMTTTKGDMTLELNTKETPITVNNFVTLSRDNFYNNVKFHRIIKDFMIQGGDPEGTGSGGPGYKFDDEKFSGDYASGTLAMANSGANTNGSQFFIVTADQSGKLPKNYTIFGKVIAGMDVVKSLAETEVVDNGQGEVSKPVQDVNIIKIVIKEE
jgi:cyclophilin family peptidyl-prolyl cis-trans isomerase